MEAKVSIAELVRNGTMSAEIAALLWAAVDERVSFLTAAQPRLAGKSTTSFAALALRPPEVPVQMVLGEPDEMAQLARERRGGYLIIEEISRGRPGIYIWGEPVQRVFQTLDAGYSLQASLHASASDEALRIVAEENGVGDGVKAFKLVLIIERFGEDEATFWRRVAEVYELHDYQDGKPIGHPLYYRWREAGDTFEKLSDPHQFGRDRADLARRAELIADLAEAGRTSPEDVAAAVTSYRQR